MKENPDLASKNEIARAFGVKGDDRVILKALLREMAGDGTIEKKGKRLATSGSLPSIAALDIFSRDKDGDLLAKPVEWNEEFGAPPNVLIRSSRGDKGPAPGVGDRILARVFANKAEGPPYTARLIKKLDKRAGAVLGIFRELPHWRVQARPGGKAPARNDHRRQRQRSGQGRRSCRGGSHQIPRLRPAESKSPLRRRFARQRKGRVDDRAAHARYPAHFSGARH